MKTYDIDYQLSDKVGYGVYMSEDRAKTERGQVGAGMLSPTYCAGPECGIWMAQEATTLALF